MTGLPRKTRKAAVSFILVTILLDVIGLGLLIPVLPDVLRRFSSDELVVSRNFGLFIGAYALMQFAASPALGTLSDRFGRRFILLGSLLGAAVDYLFMAFAPTLPLLFVGRVVSGLTGASMTVANSYMADVSDETNRSSNFAMIGACWGLGFIVGPMLGGLLGSWGPRVPFLAAAALNGLNFIYGFFVLPESLPEDRRRELDPGHLIPLRTLGRVLRRPGLLPYLVVYFLVFLAMQVNPVNWTLYTETKFGWSSWDVGLSLAFVGLMLAAVQTGLTRRLLPVIGEQAGLTAGLLIYTASFALFSMARAGWMMYAIVVPYSLSGITMPSLQTILTRQTPPNRQGELQGSLVSLGSVASILGPLVFTQLFVSFTRPDAPVRFPGAAYLGASAICALALLLRRLTPAAS